MFRLNLLEFGYIEPPYLTATDVIYSVVDHAIELERLGFNRIWLSEHYSPEFAWYSPEPLLSLIAGSTESIKVGWAGVLLRYHNPIAVINNFKILSAVFPNRIDLGVAAAYAGPNFHERMTDEWDWNDKLNYLTKLAKNEDTGLYDQHVEFPPQNVAFPSRWYLGTSERSVKTACHNEMNLTISYMHPGSDYARVGLLREYRDQYRQQHGVRGKTNVLIPFLISEDQAMLQDFSERYGMAGMPPLAGDAGMVADSIRQIAETTDTDEITLFSPLINRQQRLNNLGVVAARIGEKVTSMA